MTADVATSKLIRHMPLISVNATIYTDNNQSHIGLHIGASVKMFHSWTSELEVWTLE